MNPGNMMKLMSLKGRFENNHPRFAAFIGSFLREGLTEGMVIDIAVTRPDGAVTRTNLKVGPDDLALIEELKNLQK